MLRSNSRPARLFEVELCYVQDEINRRRVSRAVQVENG
jgi:hypothetical protein